MVYERNKKESLIEAREDLVDKIVSYRNGIEDETFAQGGRRQRYDSILEDQREALEELTEDDTAVTIGDMATVEEI